MCKARLKAAFECANKELEVYVQTSSIRLLMNKLTRSTNNDIKYSGEQVRRIKILDKKVQFNRVSAREQAEIFVQLLQACPNLEEIAIRVFTWWFYLEHIDKYSSQIELKRLKSINVGHFTTTGQSSDNLLLSLTTKYASSIERVTPTWCYCGPGAAGTLESNNRLVLDYLSRFSLFGAR